MPILLVMILAIRVGGMVELGRPVEGRRAPPYIGRHISRAEKANDSSRIRVWDCVM